jgi:hypothetical protein
MCRADVPLSHASIHRYLKEIGEHAPPKEPAVRIGGAERHAVVSNVDRSKFKPAVLCLRGGGFLRGAARRRAATALHRTKREAARTVLELIAGLREFRPDIVVVRG